MTEQFSTEIGWHDSSIELKVTGEVDVATVPLLEAALAECIGADPSRPVILDLAAVTFMDSTGLRAVVGAHKALLAQGGELRVSNARRNVAKAFRITGLDKVIDLSSSD
ncbi:MAG: STAS domain-containing protein [Acidimicrobiales bacterium]